MGRKVDVEHLVGAAEVARRLNLAGPRVEHQLRRRHPGFPARVVELDQALVWAWPDVERWARATGRLALAARRHTSSGRLGP